MFGRLLFFLIWLRDSELRRFGAIVFMVGIALHFTRSIGDFEDWPFILAGLIISPALFIFGLGRPLRSDPRSVFSLPLLLIPAFLVSVWVFFEKVFGRLDVSALIFHISAGVENAGADDLLSDALEIIVLFFLLAWCIHYLVRRDLRFALFDKIAFLPLIAITPFAQYFLATAIQTNAAQNALLDHFISISTDIGEIKEKRNLILIYMESTEQTFAKVQSDIPVFQTLQDIQSLGLSVQGIKQVENTGWTLAGFIASQCGSPLQPYGLLQRNNFDSVSSLVPGLSCLSDILSNDGYKTRYLGGASPTFAGKGTFLTGHGYQKVLGLEDYQEEVGDYINYWGLYDDTLFVKARQQIDELEAENQPYLFSLLTIGGHRPGIPDQTCLEKHPEISTIDPMLAATFCTGWHISGFLSYLDQKSIMEDTNVVILSDHLSMKTGIWDELEKYNRTNYLTIISPDKINGTIEKQSVMMDVFPTLLEVMGYDLPDRKAGLGTSLLAPTLSIIEKMGQDELNRAILSDRALRVRIWEKPKS